MAKKTKAVGGGQPKIDRVDFASEVMLDIGKATEILYNLDLRLSNHYTGMATCPIDVAVNAIRQPVRAALSQLESPNWIGNVKNL